VAVPSPRAERFAAAVDAHGDAHLGDPETERLTGLVQRLGALQVAGPRPAARAAALAAFAAGAAEIAHHAAPPAAHAAAQAATHATARTAARSAGHAAGRTAGRTVGRSAGRAAGRTAGHAIGHAAAAHALLVPVALGLSAAAVAASGVGVAAHRSLPGEPFYAVKRATESVQLHLAGGGVSGAKERLAIAHTRMAEIRDEALHAPSALRTARIASLVASLDHDVALASGPLLGAGGTATTTLRATVAAFRGQLADLPVDARIPAVVRSEALLGSLWARIGTLGLGSIPGGLPGGTAPGTTGIGPSGLLPTTGLTGLPSTLPSTLPTLPTTLPSTGPSTLPSTVPSVLPSTVPTGLPSILPSGLPSILPSGLPSVLPSLPLPTISLPITLPTSITSVIGGLLGQ
jgi:hypothetical protein